LELVPLVGTVGGFSFCSLVYRFLMVEEIVCFGVHDFVVVGTILLS
jgi:hypothetical protein